jgi:hypothetical protein
MFDQSEIDDFKLRFDALRASQPKAATAVQQPKKKGGRGGFLTSLISEGGAIGGGAAGAAAGTALLPGIGTLLGGAVGAGVGAFTGRVAENKVRDDRLGIGDAAKEGAMSALFGGGPLRIGKAALETAKGARNGLSLADALKEGGAKAVDMSLTRSLGNKLTNSGEGLIAKEFRLNPTQQSNFKNLHGEEAVSVLRRYGVKKPEDLQTQIKPLQDAFDGVVDKIPAAAKTEVQSAMQKIYKPLLDSPVLTRQQLGQSIKSQADEIVKKYGDNVPAAELNNLRKSFDDAVNYTQRGTNEYTVNKKSADGIRKLLQGKADDAGITVDGKTFKDVGLELRKLRNLDDVVGKQAYLGTGNLPTSLPNLLGAGIGGTAVGGPLGALGGFAATQVVNSNAGRRALASGAMKSGEGLVARSGANPYSAGAIAKRVAPVSLAGALAGGFDQSSLPNSNDAATINATSTNAPMNTNINALSQTTNDLSTSDPSPFAPENLQNSIKSILANGGTMKDASEFIGLAQALQEMGSSGQAKPLSAESAKVVSNAQSGLQSIDALESAMASDPDVLRKTSIPGRSVLGGALGNVLGTAGYDNLSRNILDVITRLRTGAALTASEEAFYKKQLPQAMDSPEVVQQKLGMFRDLFGSVVQKTGQGGTDQQSLTAALGV